MSDPISVLLIIGAATIGPIEAQPRVSTERYETLPELCERALKQTSSQVVGAWQIAPPEYLQYADKIYPPGTWWLDQKAPVRCIPTPSGYRK